MTLAAVLSAMREIILDAPEIPADENQRVSFYRSSFPLLSEPELTDLAKISPDKFGIYTTSIFVGEKNIIANNFPMTVRVLEQFWPHVSDAKFNLFNLIKQLHSVKPWRSTASTVLGKNFVEFIRENFAEIHALAPYLNELAEMEHAIRKIRKRPDGDFEACNGCSTQLLSQLTVEQVMSLKCAVPSCAAFQSFGYDLIAARSAFLSDRTQPIGDIVAAKINAALSRNNDGHPRWITLEDSLAIFLQSLERDKLFEIEALAEQIVSTLGGALDEEGKFVAFYKQLSELVESGVVVIPSVS